MAIGLDRPGLGAAAFVYVRKAKKSACKLFWRGRRRPCADLSSSLYSGVTDFTYLFWHHFLTLLNYNIILLCATLAFGALSYYSYWGFLLNGFHFARFNLRSQPANPAVLLNHLLRITFFTSSSFRSSTTAATTTTTTRSDHSTLVFCWQPRPDPNPTLKALAHAIRSFLSLPPLFLKFVCQPKTLRITTSSVDYVWGSISFRSLRIYHNYLISSSRLYCGVIFND